MTEWQYPLRRGANPTDDPKNGACLFDAVSWVECGRLGDHPSCVDRSLNSYGIALNDWLPFEERQRLRRFIPLLGNTPAGGEIEVERAIFIIERANAIARTAGLRLRRGRALLLPVEAYERALHCCTWSQREALIYTPAIELLGAAIRLGGGARLKIVDTAQMADAVRRFQLARAA